MAWIESNRGRLVIGFRFHGHRCVEAAGLPDTRSNRRALKPRVDRIQASLVTGAFDYGKEFPDSRNLIRFGLLPPVEAPSTVAEAAELYLQLREASVSRGTIYDYRLALKTFVLSDPIAQARIGAVTPVAAAQWLSRARLRQHRGRPVGPRRINIALIRLRAIFEMARREGWIASNPFSAVANLREPRGQSEPFSADEIGRILAAARGWERALATLLVHTGMRPGEALALKWTDIDFQTGRLAIRATRTRYGDGAPKTPGSERTLDLHKPVADALRPLRARTALRSAHVFATATGAGQSLTNIRERNWRRLLLRAGVIYRPIGHLRHTFATLALSAGADPQEVARQLGHTTVAMVYRHYSRWIKRPRGAQSLVESALVTGLIQGNFAEGYEPRLAKDEDGRARMTKASG